MEEQDKQDDRTPLEREAESFRHRIVEEDEVIDQFDGILKAIAPVLVGETIDEIAQGAFAYGKTDDDDSYGIMSLGAAMNLFCMHSQENISHAAKALRHATSRLSNPVEGVVFIKSAHVSAHDGKEDAQKAMASGPIEMHETVVILASDGNEIAHSFCGMDGEKRIRKIYRAMAGGQQVDMHAVPTTNFTMQ